MANGIVGAMHEHRPPDEWADLDPFASDTASIPLEAIAQSDITAPPESGDDYSPEIPETPNITAIIDRVDIDPSQVQEGFMLTGPHAQALMEAYGPAVAGVFARHFRQLQATPLEGEVPMTMSEILTGVRINAALSIECARLGVDDVVIRFPLPQQIHIFEDQATFAAAMSDYISEEVAENFSGISTTDKGVALVRPRTEVDSTALFAHEAMHHVALSRIEVVPHDGPLPKNIQDLAAIFNFDDNPYAELTQAVNPGEHTSGVSEAAMDLLTSKTMQGANYGDTFLRYHPIDILTAEVLVKTANVHAGEGLTLEDVSDMFVRGVLNGDMTGMRRIHAALGDEHMAAFLRLTGQEEYEEAIEVARTLGLPQAEAYLEQAQRGERVDLPLFGSSAPHKRRGV